MNMHRTKTIFIMTLIVIISGCTDSNEAANGDEAGDLLNNNAENNNAEYNNDDNSAEPNNTDEAIVEVTSIPRVIGDDSSCAEVPDDVDLSLPACVWAMSTDDVVIGEISEVELVYSPARIVQPDGSSRYVTSEECEGQIEPALKIVVDIEYSLTRNDLEQADIYISHAQIEDWFASPGERDDGEIVWRDFSDNAASFGLVEGMMVGFALHYNSDDDIWSPMGESLFEFAGDNGAKFQGQVTVCDSERYPSELIGLSRDELITNISDCQSSPTSEARAEYFSESMTSPTDYIAARCYLPSTSGQ